MAEIELRAERHDSGGINLRVGDVVVPLDVIEVNRVGDARLLIKILQVTVEIWEIDDAAEIAFEVAVINRVEAHQCAEEPPVGFDDPGAEKIAARGETFLQ